jgi:hypothetical protein
MQPYLVSWFRREPAREIAKLRTPVLIAQGTTDIQVGTSEARELHASSPASRLLIIGEMNHVLKAVASDRARQLASYSDPALPVVPQLLEEVSAFVLAVR